MRTHTDKFKENIKEFGRQLDSLITYTIDNEETVLGKEQLSSVSPHYEGGILQAVMRQLDIESNIDIPKGTEVNYKFGVSIKNGVIEELKRIMIKAGNNFYINLYYPHTTIERLRRYIETGLSINAQSLLNATIYTELTTDEENYLRSNCNISTTKVTIYPYEPIGINDYNLTTTIDATVYDYIEYINYGNYIVYSSEKQEDTSSYKIICYDKMLLAMVDYETPKVNNVAITYPISVRDYISAICSHLGLTFKNANGTFANYDKQIQQELYLTSDGTSLGYTFRDVLKELAEVTASTICINEDDGELEVRYINETNDVIDEEYLKDINVNFGEKYGPINSIVLSRSAGTDNVYLQDPSSVIENGLCELKISDNQIMNFNDRSNYLPDILNKLDGLEYYLNDFSSTGIGYLDLCDKYNIKIGENTYSCIMFNDELNVTQGLEESVYTEMPEESKTDYTKADLTDRKEKQTYLIVDKQNQTIQAVVSETTDPNNPDSMVNKVTSLNIRVGELESAISEVADLTISGESSYASVELDEINQSEPVLIKIHPTGENISYLYPNSGLNPSSTLYLKTRTLLFTRTYEEDNVTKVQYIPYELPDDLLYYDATHYDEFLLDYNSQTCQITKKCKWNADGSVGLLDSERIDSYEYPTINLGSGDYVVSLYGYQYGYIFARLMVQNYYTDQFYTKYETNSLIQQTATDINLGVSQTLTNYYDKQETDAQIDIKAGQITSSVSQTYTTKTETTNAKNEAISSANGYTDGQLENYSTTTEISSTIDQKIVDNNEAYVDIEVAKKVNNTDYNGAQIMLRVNNDESSATINADKISLAGKTINMTSDNIEINSNNFSVDTIGHVIASSMDITGGSFKVQSENLNSPVEISSTFDDRKVQISPSYTYFKNADNISYIRISNNDIDLPNIEIQGNTSGSSSISSEGLFSTGGGSNYTSIHHGAIDCLTLTQRSKEEIKKNIKKFEKALEEIKNIDVYEYNLKCEKNKHKKHIGCIIGDKYKYSKKITSEQNDSIDLYSMTSLCLQAIKEQQAIIEDLQNKIEKLERESEK